MQIKIKNRFTSNVMFEVEAEDRGSAIKKIIGDNPSANLRDADLCDANLRGANLRGANLWGCIGNMVQIKSAQLAKYEITWTAEELQIGCKNFPINKWFEFSDDEISRLDSSALEWWKAHKDLVKLMIKISPAETTGKEEE